MAKKSVKKVSFQMEASQASKALDFLKFALSKRTPEEYATRKTAARKMVAQLEAALRIEVGPDFPKGVRDQPPQSGGRKRSTRRVV